MASDDTAKLVVALEAQFDKFQKQMDQATNVADKAVTAIEGRFTAANTVISNKMSGLASAATGQLGTIGAVLGAIGGPAAAAAIVIGGLALAFAAASSAANALGEKSREMRAFAATTGLTINQLASLNKAGAEFGLSSEDVAKFVEQFTSKMEEATHAAGPLFEAVQRISPTLALQLASAKSSADALNILAAAYAKARDEGTKFQQNNLLKAAGGKGGIQDAPLLGVINDKGGVQEMAASAAAAGKAIDEGLTDRLAKLKTELDETTKRTEKLWALMFSEEVLQKELRTAQYFEQIARGAKDLADASKDLSFFQRMTEMMSRGGDPDFGIAAIANGLDEGTLKLKAAQSRLARGLKEGQRSNFSGSLTAMPDAPSAAATTNPAADAPIKLTAEANANIMRKWMSVLGEAATPTEQLRMKQADLNAALEKGGVSSVVTTRALAAFTNAQMAAAVAVRERLGLASQEEMEGVKLRQLDDDRAKGFVRGANEIAAAQRLISKEAKASSEALQVKTSNLPGLKQMEFDSQDLSKQLDHLSTDSLNNLTKSLADITTGTAKASDAFRSLGASVIRSLSEMIIKMTVIAPLAKSLQGVLGGGASGGGLFNLFGSSGPTNVIGSAGSMAVPTFADGGTVPPGGLALVSEHSPGGGRLIRAPMNQSLTVTPNDVASSSSGGVNVAPVYNIDASGADPSAIARLESVIARMNGSLEARSLAAMQSHQRRRM